jgi:hypothetical protein
MEEIKITSTTPYRSTHKEIKMDRMKVTLDMPCTSYTEFRKIIEASHLYHMTEGPAEDTPQPSLKS